MNRRLLIISPNFPPINAPDCHRVRMALPHYVAAGCEVTVLAAEPDETAQAIEPELLDTIPAQVRVIRLRPLAVRWTRRLGVSTIGLRILPALWRAGSRLLAAEKFDAVFFSTTQFITMPLGRIWLARFGVPYFIDLQDPWLSDFYERPGAPPPPGGWKYRISKALSWCLEGWTLRRAAGVISVSRGYLDTLRRRYAWFDSRRGEVIPFGVSLADFAPGSGERSAPGADEPLRIVYTGRLGGDMRLLLREFFTGLRECRRASGRSVRVEFWGTSYADADRRESIAREVAGACGVSECVFEQPARIAYLETFRRMRDADAILLLGSDDLDYSPSKVYPVAASGRPMLAIVRARSVLKSVLDELGLRSVVVISGADEPGAGTAKLLGEWMRDPAGATLDADARDRFLDRFESRAVAERQVRMFFGGHAPHAR